MKVPKGCRLSNLDKICSKITDGSHYSPKSVVVGFPMYSVKDMEETRFKKNSARNISKSDYEKLVKQNCKPQIHDILIAKDGSILKHCFVIKKNIEAVILSSIAILRPNLDYVFPEFIKYYLCQNYIKKYIAKVFTTGSGVPRIVLKDFKKIKLLLPPLPEQRKIAKILGCWDRAIETCEKLIATTKQQKQALMQQLLTAKKRFPGFTSEWQYQNFDGVYKISNNKKIQIKRNDYLSLGKYPIVDQGKTLIAGFTNNTNVYTDLPVIIFGDHTRSIKWVDFIFAQGADGTQVLKSRHSFNSKFVYYMLENTKIKNLGYSRHMKELKNKEFKISYEKKEQKKIAQVLTTADKEIEVLQQKLAYFKQEKQALMQQLLTGKRRVRVGNK